MTENKDLQKGEGNQDNIKEDPTLPQRPKHIFRNNQKNDPSRSKSAPPEEFTNEIDETEDYIGSYNYFIYYNSIKPVDPRLPKPTYKPKPNLDFIKETKDKEEEDDEAGNDNININSLENEFNQLNLEPKKNVLNNNQDTLNQNLFDENYMNNFPNNLNQRNKMSNSSNDTPSPFDYYTNSLNIPNQKNDISQQMWNEQNLGMNGMGLGIYPPGMGNMGSIMGMGMNPMSPLIGMNMGMNPYANLAQYQNMMGMNPSLMNQNLRMNNIVNPQYQNNNIKKNLNKKGNNINQDGMDPMIIQNPMFNNIYNNQAIYPQQNPMMNMNMNMMQMNQGFQRNNINQGDMNNNKNQNKRNKKRENYIQKDVNEYKNIEDIISFDSSFWSKFGYHKS